MNNLAPKLTENGMAMIIAALNGDSITFSKIAIGNGSRAGTNDLGNPLIQLGITAIEKGSNYVFLTTKYDNRNVEEGFQASELGVFAKNSNGDEFLYAYSSDTDYAEPIPDKNSNRIVETQMTIVVSVGTAEEISAILTDADAYASKEAFNNHLKNKNNPHGVTKSDVGLGNVPNVSTNNQTPTFTVASALAKLTSGEKLSTSLGKIARAINELITHTSTNSIHVTASEKSTWNGKASSKHTHAMTDLTSGTLSITRGGTGASTAEAARRTLGLTDVLSTANHYSNDVIFTSQDQVVEITVPISPKSGYTAVTVSECHIHDGNTPGADVSKITMLAMYINGEHVVIRLANRLNGANHCAVNLKVLYVKNL